MTPEIKKRIEQIRRGEVPKGYKEASMGTVPVEWNEHRLGNVYIERKGAGDPNLPVLSVSIHSGVSDGELNEDELGKQIKRIADKTQYKTALSGDLVFNMMRAWQGAIGVAHSDGLVSPAYIVARPRDVIFPQFMDYYMKTPRMISTINRQSYGVTDFRKRLYWDSFSPICCILPSSREQQKIAAILTTQDKVIELQQRKIEEVKKLKKSYLSKMFPQKGETVPEIRFPGFTEAWEQRKLGEICSEFRSGEFISADEIAETGAYPVYGGNGLRGYTNRYNHDGEYALIGRQGALCGNMKKATGKAYFTEHAVAVQAKKENSTDFLFHLLGTMNLGQYSGQSAQPGLAVSNLIELSAIVPKLQEQHQISSYFSALDNLITLHQRKLEEMQNYKKALMQLLLTGIVRVNV